jgi:hypothetical protein
VIGIRLKAADPAPGSCKVYKLAFNVFMDLPWCATIKVRIPDNQDEKVVAVQVS